MAGTELSENEKKATFYKDWRRHSTYKPNGLPPEMEGFQRAYRKRLRK
jgi:hypothetical protein